MAFVSVGFKKTTTKNKKNKTRQKQRQKTSKSFKTSRMKNSYQVAKVMCALIL